MAAVCLQNAFSPTEREPLIESGIAAQISNGHEPRNILGTIHFFNTSSSCGSRSKNVKLRFCTREMGGSAILPLGAWPPILMGGVGSVLIPKSNKTCIL